MHCTTLQRNKFRRKPLSSASYRHIVAFHIPLIIVHWLETFHKLLMASVVDILLRDHKLTEDQVSSLKFEALQTGNPLEYMLVSKNLVSDEDLTKARSEAYSIPFVDLNNTEISRDALILIDENTAKSHNALAFGFDGDKVKVAMVDPLDIQSMRFLEQKIGKYIQPYFAVRDQLQYFLESKYSQQIETQVVQELEQAEENKVKVEDTHVDDISKVAGSLKSAPVVKIINTVLDFGVKSKASDIHVEPLKDRLRFRYRINGILIEELAIPLSFAPSIVSRIKIMSKLKIDEKRVPQDGRFALRVGETEVDVRVSTLPTNFGEKVVMRLLKKTGGIPKLEDSGLRGPAYNEYLDSLKGTSGIVLITGPTGSGKTQTLASSLSLINSPTVNIITLEDPIEIVIDGVNQVQVNNEAGLTFASGLRSFLRQDPNIIMVGEIRDEETARLATQAALTGHLVFSTVHTNSAAGALPRLLDMGIETYLISSTIDMVVGERLVRILCPECRKGEKVDTHVKEEIAAALADIKDFDVEDYIKKSQKKLAQEDSSLQLESDKIYLYKPVGCSKCNNTGYIGRIGIFEVLKVDDKIREMVLEQKNELDIAAQAKKEGMITMIQDGYMKVLDGITTLEEVLRVAKD
jgi:type IV pilus assembly protein PilB